VLHRSGVHPARELAFLFLFFDVRTFFYQSTLCSLHRVPLAARYVPDASYSSDNRFGRRPPLGAMACAFPRHRQAVKSRLLLHEVTAAGSPVVTNKLSEGPPYPASVGCLFVCVGAPNRCVIPLRHRCQYHPNTQRRPAHPGMVALLHVTIRENVVLPPDGHVQAYAHSAPASLVLHCGARSLPLGRTAHWVPHTTMTH